MPRVPAKGAYLLILKLWPETWGQLKYTPKTEAGGHHLCILPLPHSRWLVSLVAETPELMGFLAVLVAAKHVGSYPQTKSRTRVPCTVRWILPFFLFYFIYLAASGSSVVARRLWGHAGSVVVARGLSCSEVCGILVP